MSPKWMRGAWILSTEVALVFQTFNVLLHVLLQVAPRNRGVITLKASVNSIVVFIQSLNQTCRFLGDYRFHFIISWNPFRFDLGVISLAQFRFYLKWFCFNRFRFHLGVSSVKHFWFPVERCIQLEFGWLLVWMHINYVIMALTAYFMGHLLDELSLPKSHHPKNPAKPAALVWQAMAAIWSCSS